MMAYKILTSLIGVLRHDFTTFGYLLFTNQYLAISEAVLDSFGVKIFPNCQKSSPYIYGFCLQRGMCYGLLWLYGLCHIFPCKPTWWTENPMGLKGVWGNWAMGYEGVDCRQIFLCKPAIQAPTSGFGDQGTATDTRRNYVRRNRTSEGLGDKYPWVGLPAISWKLVLRGWKSIISKTSSCTLTTFTQNVGTLDNFTLNGGFYWQLSLSECNFYFESSLCKKLYH